MVAVHKHDKMNTPYLGRTITNLNCIHEQKTGTFAALLREPQISQIEAD